MLVKSLLLISLCLNSILAFSLVNYTVQSKSVNQIGHNGTIIGMALANILFQLRHLTNLSPWIVTCMTTEDFLNDMMFQLRTIARKMPLTVNINDNRYVSRNMGLKILLIANVEDIYKIKELPSVHDVQFSTPQKRKYLIIFLSELRKMSEVIVAMSKIFAHYMHTHYQLDVTILTSNPYDHGPELYTFMPYRDRECLSTAPVLIASYWQKHFLDIVVAQIFPEKLGNFHGCPVTVVVYNVEPFVVVNWKAVGMARINGFDASVIKILAERLNFTIILQKNEPEEFVGGAVYPNGSMIGCFKLLGERRANITLGRLSITTERRRFLTATTTIYQTVLFIILNCGYSYPAYALLLLPFTPPIWLICAAFITLQMAYKWKLLSSSKLFVKCALVTWLFVYLVLRSAYEGSLFVHISAPPTYQLPVTINEMFAKNYKLLFGGTNITIGADKFYRLSYVMSSHVGSVKNTIQLIVNRKQHKVATIITKDALTYYLSANPEQIGDIYILPQLLYIFHDSMYFTKFSYIERAVSPMVQRLHSQGIITKFVYDYFFKKLSYNKFWKVVRRNNRKTTQGIHQTTGSFIMAVASYCLMLHAIAALVFAFECCYAYLAKKKKKLVKRSKISKIF